MSGSSLEQGTVTCAAWIWRPENAHLVAIGKARNGDQPSVLEIFSFDAKTSSLSSSALATIEIEEGDLLKIAVHPSGDDIVCSTTDGSCKWIELYGQQAHVKLMSKDLAPLQDVGRQICLAFSVDGSRFASGGVDGHLRIFEWPSLRVILDEPKACKSFRDMDFSLDSEFLATTSSDGSARIWQTSDGLPVVSNLTRYQDEKIELCRFSKDGMKPFLFCTVQKGNKAVTGVWDISTWKRIGHKRLLGKSASMMSMSLDGKYLALGSKDGDMCVVDVKKMEISHWSKRLHLGSSFASIEFCPSERVVITATEEWGAMVTKLNVPADWKDWQIYLVLLGLFLASAVGFYIFFQNSDSFWNFPLGKNQPARSIFGSVIGDSQTTTDDQNVWGPVDL
ncbi:SEC12-like protein 1 [Impatiens glandulifera]|uniref:SEC12-like protein 1 n=1 Tax=Impatiens glandulifera TaxID=253017 RepID=UPI001FB10F37|nr:SEC12-like protein 1 [Impatiens glandulifera]